MALSRFTGRGRRPRLRVVAPTLAVPRRLMGWRVGYLNLVAEFWTEAEWATLSPAERPDHASILPGLGWLVVDQASEADFADARESHRAALERWQAQY